MHSRQQLAARKIKVRSQCCQKTTSISNQLENQGYSAGFEVNLLLSGVRQSQGYFSLSIKALHTYQRDPRGENIPFQEVAEAKLHLPSHVRARTFGYRHLGFCGSTRGLTKNTQWVVEAVTAEGCQEMPFPASIPIPAWAGGWYGGKAFPVTLFPNSQSQPDSSQTHQKQNSFGQAGLKRWEWRKGTIKPWGQRKGQ